jgi:hypothetical protein
VGEGIGYLIVAVLIIGFIYSFAKQIHHTFMNQKVSKTFDDKRLRFGIILKKTK